MFIFCRHSCQMKRVFFFFFLKISKRFSYPAIFFESGRDLGVNGLILTPYSRSFPFLFEYSQQCIQEITLKINSVGLQQFNFKPPLQLSVKMFWVTIPPIEYDWRLTEYFDKRTAICMLLTLPKSVLHRWKEEWGSKLSHDERPRKIWLLSYP